jgi:hypothetical protein
MLTHAQESEVRAARVCPGCGGPKDPGCIVCWPCLKYRDQPFKYFQNDTPRAGDLELWLASIGRPTLTEQGIL